MKSVLLIFEDDEFSKLTEIRKKMTWRRFVLKLAGLPYEVIPYVHPEPFYAHYKKRRKKRKKEAEKPEEEEKSPENKI